MATDDLFEPYADVVDDAIDTLYENPGEEYTARDLLDEAEDIESEQFPLYEGMLEDRLVEEIEAGEYDDLSHRETRFPFLTTRYFSNELQYADDEGSGLLPTAAGI